MKILILLSVAISWVSGGAVITKTINLVSDDFPPTATCRIWRELTLKIDSANKNSSASLVTKFTGQCKPKPQPDVNSYNLIKKTGFVLPDGVLLYEGANEKVEEGEISIYDLTQAKDEKIYEVVENDFTGLLPSSDWYKKR